MFDVGFSELIVIGIVALVVIGPEKLPRVARTVGHLLGRAQRYVNDVKADINREIHLEELKKMQTEMTESMRSLETHVRQEMDVARTAVEAPAQEAIAVMEETPEVLPTPVATHGLLGQLETPVPAPAPVEPPKA